MDTYHATRIIKIKGDYSAEAEDFVAIERKVRISVNGKNVLSVYCTPSMIKEFVVGVAFNEGLLVGEWCPERITIEYGEDITADIPAAFEAPSDGEKIITSGCGGGVTFERALPEGPLADNIQFSAGQLKILFREFQRRSEAYKLTGGVHSAALTDGENILVFSEDIGRHNAVDKVIGYCLLEGINFSSKMMLASGRLSSEITSKCIRSGIPVLVSRAAPTSLAVRLAESSGLTVVGFVRGDRMNIYSGRQRIVL